VDRLADFGKPRANKLLRAARIHLRRVAILSVPGGPLQSAVDSYSFLLMCRVIGVALTFVAYEVRRDACILPMVGLMGCPMVGLMGCPAGPPGGPGLYLNSATAENHCA